MAWHPSHRNWHCSTTMLIFIFATAVLSVTFFFSVFPATQPHVILLRITSRFLYLTNGETVVWCDVILLVHKLCHNVLDFSRRRFDTFNFYLYIHSFTSCIYAPIYYTSIYRRSGRECIHTHVHIYIYN